MTRSDGDLGRAAERCLLPGFTGTEPPDWLLRRVAGGLGGVVLYGRNVASAEQVAALNRALHRERPELLVAIDEEGGDVTRLEVATGSGYPGNLALGHAGDVRLTRAVAASMGALLARAGVDLDLAPDADVNSNPANPVIGVRSFGADPERVAEQTVAFVEGLQGAGVAACVKHFPGHGDTSQDSHHELPTAAEDPRRGALRPFQAAIAAGVRAVMSAHVVVPSLDSAPATLSRPVLTDLLRGELGFTGLVISDGIDMRAISDGTGLVAGAVLALAAGCDAICVGGGPTGEDIIDELRDAMVAAVRSGRLPEARLLEAAGRVDALAAWRAVQRQPSAPDPAVGLAAARRGLLVDGRVRVGREAVVVQLQPPAGMAAGVVPWGVAAALAERGIDVRRLAYERGPIALQEVLSAAAGRSLVITVRDLHRHPWQGAAVESLLRARPDAVLVEMGLPAVRPAAAAAYVATHGASRVSGLAAAEALLR
jgi:beta-N-acetylhexosaminidase